MCILRWFSVSLKLKFERICKCKYTRIYTSFGCLHMIYMHIHVPNAACRSEIYSKNFIFFKISEILPIRLKTLFNQQNICTYKHVFPCTLMLHLFETEKLHSASYKDYSIKKNPYNSSFLCFVNMPITQILIGGNLSWSSETVLIWMFCDQWKFTNLLVYQWLI